MKLSKKSIKLLNLYQLDARLYKQLRQVIWDYLLLIIFTHMLSSSRGAKLGVGCILYISKPHTSSDASWLKSSMVVLNMYLIVGTICGLLFLNWCVFRMSTTTQSQATCDQEATTRNIEGRFTKMEEWMKKMALEMEILHWENEGAPREGVATSQNKQIKG